MRSRHTQLVLAEADSTLKIAPKAGREGGYRPTILSLLDWWEDGVNDTLRDVFDEHQADDGPKVRLITQPEDKDYPSLEPDEDEDEDEFTDDDVSMMLSSPPSSPIATPPAAEAAASWPTFASFGEPAS